MFRIETSAVARLDRMATTLEVPMFHRRKLLPLYIAATLASGHVAAVGLGDLSLHSYLGKPLQAEVALSHMGDLTVDQLKVQIGSEGDYSALGVEYNYLHSRLRIEPFTKDGQTYVRITTTEPISEPYLNFVLNLRWPQGQVVREFTVLLDPAPETAVAASQPVPAAPPAALAADADLAAPVPAARESVRPAPRPVRSQSTAPERTVAGSYTTQRGDSLWRLAAKLRPSAAVSVEQMMAALHSANPDAFVGGDAARLKEAVTLDIAAAERIALQGGTGPAAAALAAAPAPAGGQAGTTATSTPAPAAPKQPANQTAATQDGLVQENVALKAQVAELSENVATLNSSLAASTDRLREMEARLDSVLQQFQQQRTALTGEPATAAAAIAQPGAMINQVNAAELRPAPKAHTPWWVHLLYWSGIAAAVGWAIREHFWPARRLALAGFGGDAARADEPVEPAAPRVSTAAASAARVVPREAAAPAAAQPWQLPENEDELTLDLGDILPPDVAAADSEIELDLPRQPEEQVDASISAGVFVAFGRFDEAERLLTEALRKDPARDDLRLQLLDVYLQSDQSEAFERLAAEIESSSPSVETLAELAVLRDSFDSRG